MTSDIPAFPPIQDALGALLAGRDWTTTPLGHPDRWPAVVRSTLATWLDSPQPMCMAWGADLRFFFNAAYAPMLGARVGSAMGQPFREVWPDVWADIEPIVERALAGVGSRFDEMPLTMTRNGYPEETWWTFTYQPLRDEEARVIGMLCTTTDVTAQVLGRRQAMRERERQQRLLQQMPGFVAVTTGPGHVFAYVNDAFRRIAGERDFIGGTVRDVFPELASQGFYEMIDAVYATGRPNVVRSHPLRLSGDAQDRYIDLLCQPTFDETGAIHGLFCGGYEVTEGVTATAGLRRLNETLEQRVEERTADLMRAQDALRQSQKLEAVGQLTGGIAHDFNNLLTVVQGFSDALLNQLDRSDERPLDPDRARRSLRAVLDAAERGAELTQQLLAFSRRQKLSGRVTNIDDLVRTLLPMLERTIGDAAITIEIEPCGAHCNARIDAAQAEAAVIGIVMNARDAMPDGGTIILSASHVTLDGSDPRYGEKLKGNFVALSIADTGTGMTEDVRHRVTEPFFTTKDQGKGTGLGLSMVYGFMKQSDGALHIESQEGAGTTVRLLFPAVSSVAEPIRQQGPSGDSDLRGDETVLIVEDQRDVGDLAETILKDLGYAVLRASNGVDAITLLESDATIDLLFTDLIMPGGINGVTVARAGRQLRPGLKVLLTTGYAEASIERVDARGTEFELIGKPYKRADLATRVRHVLDGPSGTG